MATGNDFGGNRISIAIGFDRKTFVELNAIAKREDRPFAAMVRVLVGEALGMRHLEQEKHV